VIEEPLATHQKAFAVNMDLGKYGAFAEIGAGQEVARWFFRAGGAAGTVAKTVSAYDMDVSNSFYGKTDRYVSRQRLQTMLDYEYGRLQEELDAKRGDKTTFFVFADTRGSHQLQAPRRSAWLDGNEVPTPSPDRALPNHNPCAPAPAG
jgi:hypothetical protein